MPPVTPSAISIVVGTGSLDSILTARYSVPIAGSIFSTAPVSTSFCATVVFLCSPTATRGVEPASSWRARAPAVTTNSNELGSLVRSIMSCNSLLTHRPIERRERPTSATAASASSRARSASTIARSRSTAARQLVVDHDEVVLRERGDFVARHLQPPLDGLLAVLAPAAQPLLEHGERRRHHEHRSPPRSLRAGPAGRPARRSPAPRRRRPRAAARCRWRDVP